MNFISLHFIFFLAAAVFFYHLLPLRYRSRYLLFASYLFYFTWSVKYALLMLCSTLLFYFVAIFMESSHKDRTKYLKIALFSQLLILIGFKAADAWLVPLANLFPDFLPVLNSPGFKLLMPIGISYYTFKLIGYILDVYWGKIQAEKDFTAFACFVSFFPQILSGPIQRAQDFLPQIKNARAVDESMLAGGLRLILFGFFKKLVVADNMDYYVNDLITASPSIVSFISNYFIVIQIYADFSAITDIAIGMGRLFGIHSPKNFDSPFYASNIQDFWRRWHMSLTGWLRDYLFTPLQLKLRHLETAGLYLSILINMSAIGLWHGFSWNFVIFGLIHTCYIIVSVKTLKTRDKYFKKHRYLSMARKIAAPLITFHMVLLSFVFFRYRKLSEQFTVIKNAFSYALVLSKSMSPAFILKILKYVYGLFSIFSSFIIMECIHLAQSHKRFRPVFESSITVTRWIVYWILIIYIIAYGKFDTLAFIYSGF